MGEIAINPIHNVHKKYRQMNFVNPYIFTAPVIITVENTFIGGVASTINTPALLASKLAIDVSRITVFSVVGSDIKCKITGSYPLPVNCFNGNTSITYYTDNDGLVSSLGAQCFGSTTKIIELNFKNCLQVDGGISASSNIENIILANCTTIIDGAFQNNSTLKLVYIPRVTALGSTTGANNIFTNNPKIYAHPSLQTNNAGGVDGDLVGKNVIFTTNYTSPNSITNLSLGGIYATALQLNFIPPTGNTNSIDYYECYVNGVYKNKIKGSAGYIVGLLPNTSYKIEVKPVDVFYNKSTSNVITQITATPNYTDADANAAISASSLTGSEQESAYKLITDLKANSLWVKTQAIYLFKGTTAAQQKFNAKNPLDTNASFRLAFTGTATFSNLGYQLNGSSFADTNFIPSVNQNVNSSGVTLVCGSNNASFSGDTYEIGSQNNGTQSSILSVKVSAENLAAYRFNGTYLTASTGNQAQGIFTAVKQSATVSKLFKNSAVLSSGSSSGTLPTVNCFIGAINLNGSAYGNSNQRIQIVIIHEGLSDAEVTTLHSIIDLSESLAGRKTW